MLQQYVYNFAQEYLPACKNNWDRKRHLTWYQCVKTYVGGVDNQTTSAV